MSDLKENNVFAANYLLTKQIGYSDFAETWEARYIHTELLLVLKIYKPLSGLGQERARHEFDKSFKLIHNNILTPSHFDVYNERPFVVMMHCEHGSAQQKVGKIAEDELARLLIDISSSVKYIHEQNPPIIHQDIRPGNFMLNDTDTYMLSNFGISDEMRSALGQSVGTKHDAYKAPELFKEGVSKSKSSDIFALGVSLFELVTGILPFGKLGGSLLQRQGIETPHIPTTYTEGLNKLVKRCLSKEASDRPVASELREQAQYYLEHGSWGKPAITKQSNPTLVKKSSTKKEKTVVAAAAAGSKAVSSPKTKDEPIKKSGSKKWILAAAGIALLASFAYFLSPYFTQSNADSDSTTGSINPKESKAEDEKKTIAQNPVIQKEPFTYQPPTPVDGTLKGVVELGATGFNSFIILADADKNWALKKADFGSSLVHENMATQDDIRSGLKNYIAEMLEFGVAGSHIHFVVSSGAAKEVVTKKITKGLKKLGYVVNRVTAEEEAIFALKSVLPQEFEDKAFVVDIGSSNTKISYITNGEQLGMETNGSKHFQRDISSETVYKEAKDMASSIPQSNTKYCFIIGGVPYKLAKKIRNEKERYTVLNDPADYDFDAKKIKCGLNIYQAIMDGTDCQQFVFDWNANFTIGFLLDAE